MNQEAASWPYEFAVSKDYIKSNQRGSVSGKLFVNDRYIFFHIYIYSGVRLSYGSSASAS